MNNDFNTNYQYEIIKNRAYIFRDSFQNFKTYGIPHAQLIIADPPYCYDEDTECFTREGWKKYTEICPDDELLSLNHETQEMCYSGIKDIIVRDNDEDMYSFDSMHLNLFVSSKHRCYAVNKFIPNLKHGARLRNRQRVHKENIVLAKDISAAAYIPRSGYDWHSTCYAEEYFRLPSCEVKNNQYSSKFIPEVEIKLDDWLSFFGLWLADGCTTKKSDRESGYTVSIKQYGDNRKRVEEIMSKLPWKVSNYEYQGNASNIEIHSKQLYLYLETFGKSRDKYIPRWILDLPKRYLEILWEAYTFGDSSKNGEGIRISSVSKKLIENLQEIALKLGVICQIRTITHKDWGDTELFYFNFNDKSKNIKYANKKVIQDYKGKVWCVTLQTNSVFLIRRKGLICFSGNCIGKNAYASNPAWYKDGDNKNGESELAGKEFFDTDKDFRPAEFMHFCSQMLVKEPKQGISDEDIETVGKSGSRTKSKAPCMILFCAFEQLHYYIDLAQRYGFKHYIPLVFRKNFSAQVLKANMKVVGNCEYGLILYKDKLPKFNNNGEMIFNCFDWVRDNVTPKVHPTQKPVPLLERLIEIFSDPDDVIIDPCAGSGSTLRAAIQMNRKAYGFEIKKDFYKAACEKVLKGMQQSIF